MKIILLEDIPKLGKKNDVKQVTNGYARNFLIPKKMAVLATAPALKDLEEQKKTEAQQAEEELLLFQEIASKLDGLEFEMPAKIGQDDKLFGSITGAKIADFIKAQGYDIKKEQIKLEEPIKEIGEYDITIDLPHGLETNIKIIVIEEKPES